MAIQILKIVACIWKVTRPLIFCDIEGAGAQHYNLYSCLHYSYCIAGNFCGVRLRMVNLSHFAGLNFVDAHTHAHYVLYNRAYFTDLISMVRQSSTKIGPLEKFPAIQYIHIQEEIFLIIHIRGTL